MVKNQSREPSLRLYYILNLLCKIWLERSNLKIRLLPLILLIQEESRQQRTADEIIKDDRCVVPRELYNEIGIIASTNKMTNCEVQLSALNDFVERNKLASDCLSVKVQDDSCKCVVTKRNNL